MTELSRASVVEIRTYLVSGTGFVYRVDNNGKAWILTNEHVIRGARTVTVRLSGNGGTRTGTVLGQDEIRDLAVLTICCNRSWKALPTLSTNTVQLGSDVAALGFPSFRVGSELSVTTGVVSSYGFQDARRAWVIQTDAALNPGNSGGPLLNENGQVIGVISSRIEPLFGENIGYAIAMRTVDQELDHLEAGRTVLASPTPRPTRIPTRTPTRVPTTVPPLGTSGFLVHNPDDGNIGCSSNRYSATVISSDTIDSAAFVRFEVPNVRRWSIGFVYHDPTDPNSRNTESATLIWSNGTNGIFARHWARIDGVQVHQPPNERLDTSVLRTGRGQLNELSFRTSLNGTSLRLNQATVMEVPASQMSRRYGRSVLCAGFHSTEDVPYSIRYSDLRTRFTREGVSGSLSHPVPDDGLIECPRSTFDNAHITHYATDSWFVADFIVPYVDKWSFGIVYHGGDGRNSRTYIYGNGTSHRAAHSTYDDGTFLDETGQWIASSRLAAGATVRLEFETTRDGSRLYLDGAKVLEVSSRDLTRRIGRSMLCTGLINGESEPYTIHFSDLWAWAE